MTSWTDVLSPFILMASALASVSVLMWAVLGSNWQALKDHTMAQHLLAGSVLVMTLMWAGSASVRSGLEFSLLGLTAVVLMMGIRLALVAGFLAQLLSLVMAGWLHQQWSWSLLGYDYLLHTALPMLFSYGFYRWVYLRLSHNPFIYILVAGFFNAGLTHALADLMQGGVLWGLSVYSLEQIWHDYWRYLPLMMFPEGVVNGMFIAGMVAFHPLWLSTFDEESYFH